MRTQSLSQTFDNGKMKPTKPNQKPVEEYYTLNFSGARGSKWHIFPSLRSLEESLCGKKKVKQQDQKGLQKILQETENFLEQAPGLGTFCRICQKSARKTKVSEKN